MFGEKLKEQMKEKKVTIASLSRTTRISTVSLTKYLNDSRLPNVNNLMKVCKALDLNYDAIYDEFYLKKEK